MDRRTISRALPCNSRAKWPNYVSPPGMLGSGEGVAGLGYWPTFIFRDWEESNGTRVLVVNGLIVHELSFTLWGRVLRSGVLFEIVNGSRHLRWSGEQRTTWRSRLCAGCL